MGYKTNDGFNEARYKLRLKRKTPLTDIMTEDELCIWFGCSRDTLVEYRNKQELPYIKVGRDVYYSEEQVYLWMINRQMSVIKEGKGKFGELPVVFKAEKKRRPQKIKKIKKLVSAENNGVSEEIRGDSEENKGS